MEVQSAGEKQLCRTCLRSESSLKSLFSAVTIDGDYYSLDSMLAVLTSIQVTTSDKSQSICENCINKLLQSFLFRQQCVRVNNAFLTLTQPKNPVKDRPKTKRTMTAGPKRPLPSMPKLDKVSSDILKQDKSFRVPCQKLIATKLEEDFDPSAQICEIDNGNVCSEANKPNCRIKSAGRINTAVKRLTSTLGHLNNSVDLLDNSVDILDNALIALSNSESSRLNVLEKSTEDSESSSGNSTAGTENGSCSTQYTNVTQESNKSNDDEKFDPDRAFNSLKNYSFDRNSRDEDCNDKNSDVGSICQNDCQDDLKADRSFKDRQVTFNENYRHENYCDDNKAFNQRKENCKKGDNLKSQINNDMRGPELRKRINLKRCKTALKSGGNVATFTSKNGNLDRDLNNPTQNMNDPNLGYNDPNQYFDISNQGFSSLDDGITNLNQRINSLNECINSSNEHINSHNERINSPNRVLSHPNESFNNSNESFNNHDGGPSNQDFPEVQYNNPNAFQKVNHNFSNRTEELVIADNANNVSHTTLDIIFNNSRLNISDEDFNNSGYEQCGSANFHDLSNPGFKIVGGDFDQALEEDPVGDRGAADEISLTELVHYSKENICNDETQEIFKCETCGETFPSKFILQKHVVVHNESINRRNSGSECSVCKKQFTRPSDTKRHMLTHSGVKPHSCILCKKSFSQSGTLAKHMKKKHQEVRAITITPDRMHKPNSHLCSVCGKPFKHSYNLTLHLRRHSGDKPFQCKHCNLGFVSGARLKAHMRTHTGDRPYSCNTCRKNFAHHSVLSMHKKSHSGERPHQCGDCGKSFVTLYELNIHRRKHTGEKPCECNVCNKTFSDPKVLKQHKRIHSQEKSHLCNICGKRFGRKNHLTTHMKTHEK